MTEDGERRPVSIYAQKGGSFKEMQIASKLNNPGKSAFIF